MPDAPKHPVTVGMLHVVTGRYLGEVDGTRPATVADLVSALRAEGVLVVEPGLSPEELMQWFLDNGATRHDCVEHLTEAATGTSLTVRGDGAVLKAAWVLPDALAEAQPFPPAGGVS